METLSKFIGAMFGVGFALFIIVFILGGAYTLAIRALDSIFGI